MRNGRSSAPAAPVAPSAPAPKAEPFGDVGLNEVNEKDWLAGVRRNIAQREGIAAADLRFSPGFLRATFARSSPIAVPAKSGRRVSPRRHWSAGGAFDTIRTRIRENIEDGC
jgi:hypothetical protein